ncbi:hypothetical protein SDC9_08490 [bioreactor metagenome]|uniref:Uncharacterized protein n=1 Tax=bioreactor metagenome TaxID=1076179 RepID=A0A644T7S5_9ZZZZ
MNLKNKKIIYIFILILIIFTLYLLNINSFYIYFNLAVYWVFLYFLVVIYKSKFGTFHSSSEDRLVGMWGLFLGLCMLLPNSVITLIGSFIVLYIMKIIFCSDFFTKFEQKLWEIPIWISFIMLIVSMFSIENIFGYFIELVLLGIQILFLVHVYKKRRNFNDSFNEKVLEN